MANWHKLMSVLPTKNGRILVATLTVLKFPEADGADRMISRYLLFRRRAQQLMPKVRDWINTNNWLVNIIVYVVFIALILLG